MDASQGKLSNLGSKKMIGLTQVNIAGAGLVKKDGNPLKLVDYKVRFKNF